MSYLKRVLYAHEFTQKAIALERERCSTLLQNICSLLGKFSGGVPCRCAVLYMFYLIIGCQTRISSLVPVGVFPMVNIITAFIIECAFCP